MKIAYANAFYKSNSSTGGNAHINQFINNTCALGNDIWAWPGNDHPAVKILPSSYFNFVRTLRDMDILYIRIEASLSGACRWTLPPYRQIYGFPLIVWEFNTVPEYGLLRGKSDSDIQRNINAFKHYGRGCDLAICVSQRIAEYVSDNLGIERVLFVPNGSDPDIFRPDLPPVTRMSYHSKQLNVVWIGSAYIPWHNFDLLSEAAKIFWDRSEDKEIVFHILGPDLKGVMANMPPNVYYYGSVDYHVLPIWLAGMDVGLVTYHPGPADYSSPLKLFDYMASGLTVVGSDQPQLRDVLNEIGQSDFLVSPGDYLSLTNILSALEKDRGHLKQRGDAARQLIIEKYNWRKIVQHIYQEIDVIQQR